MCVWSSGYIITPRLHLQLRGVFITVEVCVIQSQAHSHTWHCIPTDTASKLEDFCYFRGLKIYIRYVKEEMRRDTVNILIWKSGKKKTLQRQKTTARHTKQPQRDHVRHESPQRLKKPKVTQKTTTRSKRNTKTLNATTRRQRKNTMRCKKTTMNTKRCKTKIKRCKTIARRHKTRCKTTTIRLNKTTTNRERHQMTKSCQNERHFTTF